MKVIAIITARSGSKSVPHKNVKKLGGIPLLGWVIKAASKSKCIDEIILSTDSQHYYKIARSFNTKIIFHKRTSALAEDVPSEFILLDVIKKEPKFFQDDDTIIVLIQPTTPFLRHSDIDECVNKLIKHKTMNTCLSVKIVSEHPEWMITKINNFDDVGKSKNFSGSRLVRQNLHKRWMPNGGVYVMRKSFLEKKRRTVDTITLVHEMPKINSVDIDEKDDFAICEALVKSGIVRPQ